MPGLNKCATSENLREKKYIVHYAELTKPFIGSETFELAFGENVQFGEKEDQLVKEK